MWLKAASLDQMTIGWLVTFNSLMHATEAKQEQLDWSHGQRMEREVAGKKCLLKILRRTGRKPGITSNLLESRQLAYWIQGSSIDPNVPILI